MIDKKAILKKAQDYDVITFDVFDTLLIRDVMVPADIFTIAYGSVGRYIRVISELIARSKSKSGEITLEDISRICPFSCDKELEIEKNYCRANPPIFDIYKQLKENGKKIYAVSDMYLSSDYITSILKNSGYDIPVIVSCEENHSKKDGSLFKVFMERNSLSPEKILHIGDNYESDGEGAKIAGIIPLIIEKHSDMLSYTDYSISDPELSSFINHGLNELSDPMEKIGYEVVGPIILSFCQWIHIKYIEFGFDRLYFLARDMRFSYEMYRTLYPNDDVRYLCVSRRSLAYAKEHPEDFCKYLKCEGCYGNVSIVDTGWVGGMQLDIEHYAKMLDESTDLGGLYLGAKLAFSKLRRSKRSSVFLFPDRWNQFKAQLFPPFMETLIGCNEKQVISYENGFPVFDRQESRDQTVRIKSGAQRLIEDWNCCKINSFIDVELTKKAFERMFYFPKRYHIELIGNLKYEDSKESSIVSYDKNCNYLLHPRKFISDLSDSGWKGAFLKKSGCLYILFLSLYFLFGAFRLYYLDLKKIGK